MDHAGQLREFSKDSLGEYRTSWKLASPVALLWLLSLLLSCAVLALGGWHPDMSSQFFHGARTLAAAPRSVPAGVQARAGVGTGIKKGGLRQAPLSLRM